MGRVSYKEKMLRYSKNNVSTLGDMVLLATLLGAEFFVSAKPRTSVGAAEQVRELKKFGLWAKKNHTQIKRTYYRLQHQGLLELVKTEAYIKPRITKQGLKRLYSVIPQYDEVRAWDGNLYIITYDISEKKRYDRNTLRKYLKKIGCGMLQQSVWITPYNPKNTISEFLDSRKLQASVLISDVATDEGMIGSEATPQLIERVYRLVELNKSYKDFIHRHSGKKKKSSPSGAFMDFHSILANDPQLPFPLLPDYWLGGKAYKLLLSLEN